MPDRPREAMAVTGRPPVFPLLMVVSDSRIEAMQVKSLLDREFGRVQAVVDEDGAVGAFEHQPPDVLVLAFRSLEKCERFYLRLFRHSTHANAQTHKTVVLCSKGEVHRAYELCRTGIFDDYILFRPLTFDAPRLTMSIHQALRDLAAQRLSASPPPKAAGFFTRPATGLRRPAQEPPTSSPCPAGAVAPPGEPGEGQPMVLVVDDEAFIRNVVGRMLASDGHRLAFAENGRTALKLLPWLRPDLILMDVMMPEIDGIETTRQIRAVEGMADTPIMIMTGRSDKHLVIDCVKAGARDFVIKPFDRQTLLAKVQALLEGS